jgi:ribosomal protein S6
VKKTKTTEQKPSNSAGKPSMGVVNKYELVVIYPSSENDLGADKQITEKCKKRSLKVVETDKWGTKTMSYEIKKQNRGYYLKLVLEGTSESARLLEKDLQMDDKMLRFLLIRI